MLFRNLLFYAGIIPATLFFTLCGLLFFFLPLSSRYWIITRWSHFFIVWAKLCCGLSYKISGLEHIPSHNAIALCNHQSAWETIFMQTLLPEQTWVLKKELLNIPVFGWGLALINPIAINRKERNSIHELIRQGRDQLKAGRWVILFPEGTRVSPGVDHRYSKSGATLAKESGFSILPIAHNAGLFWPKGFFIKKSGTIQIVIGPVINPQDKTTLEIYEISTHWIKTKAAELL